MDEYGTAMDLAVAYDGTWYSIGNMMVRRAYHRSLVSMNTITHIGGFPGTQYVIML